MSESAEAIQTEWNDIWLEYDQINHAKMLARWKKFDFDSLDKDTAIIDIGAGIGEFLDMLAVRGFHDIIGLEPEAQLRARNERGLLVEGGCLDLSNIHKQYDVALIFGVLHHLENFEEMKQTCENLKKVLKPGGRFYSVEPWKHLLRSVVTKIFLETPLGKLHPYFSIERRIWAIEKPLLSQWLELEHDFIRHMTENGFKIVLDKKDLRAHYIIYERT